MALSATQIRDRAGNELGVLRLGQSLQSQDAARITSGYTEVYNGLKNEGLATWAFTGNVPDDVAPWVIGLVAFNCSETFGISNERYTRIVNKVGPGGALALREIRRLVQPRYESQDEVVDY